jgi:LuxR family maltose regulon positive regulatory protein
MEVYLLRALVLYRQGEESVSAGVMENMEKALDLAVDPGFMMLFLEEGQELVPLLSAVVNHRPADERIKRHARKLLQAFAEMGKTSDVQAVITVDELVEQLTPREMEVLLLIATGDSNQEIAEKLVITVRTVKKHTSNIYGKLSVNSRMQAVARARELGLLSAD